MQGGTCKPPTPGPFCKRLAVPDERPIGCRPMQTAIRFAGRGTQGPPLLLVHGFPMDHRMWRGQMDGLADVARVVALDLPGFGGTPPVTGTPGTPDGAGAFAPMLTMDDLADHVLALADALGFARF